MNGNPGGSLPGQEAFHGTREIYQGMAPSPPPGVGADDMVGGILDHLGLVTFTIISIGLMVYLLYSMLHPERF